MEVYGGSQFPGGVVGMPVDIDVNSATPALTITQRGSGNALLVEDSASVDATPFVVSATGNVGIGVAAPGTLLHAYNGVNATFLLEGNSATEIIGRRSSNDASAGNFAFDKNRAGAIVQSNDALGNVSFRGFDGTTYRTAAQIVGVVGGTPGAADMPGALTFSTTPDGSTTLIERMRINNAGLITGSGPSLGAWTTSTPTPTASSGTFTTVSASMAHTVIGKTCTVAFRIVITTNGTAAGIINLPLPFQAFNGAVDYVGSGRETVGAFQCVVNTVPGGTLLSIRRYDGTYAGGSGTTINGSLTYETV